MDTKYNMIMNLDAIVKFQETKKAKLDFYVELEQLAHFLNGSIVNNELNAQIYYNKRTIYENGRVYGDTIMNSFITITLTREMVEYLRLLHDGEADIKALDPVNEHTQELTPEEIEEQNTRTQALNVIWGDDLNDLNTDVKTEQKVSFIHMQGEMTNNDLNLVFVNNITLGDVIVFDNKKEITNDVLTWRLHQYDDNLDELLITTEDYARMQAIVDAKEEAKHQAEIAEIEKEMQAIIEAPIDDDDADLAEVFSNFNERHLNFYKHNSYVIYILYGVIAFLMTLVIILATTAS